MLDLFLLFSLINYVKRTVSERGRRPGGYIAMTVLMWVIPEIIGLTIGILSGLGYGTYIIAFIFGAAGGGVAFLIVRNLKPGNYVSKTDRLVQQFSQTYEPLRVNCRITINRVSALSGASVTYEMYLNDRNIGTLINGSSLVATTDQRQNILVAKVPDSYDIPPFIFEVPDGGNAQIQFQGGRFIPESCSGIMNYGKNVNVNPEAAVPRTQPANFSAQPPVYAPTQSPFANPAPVQPSPFAAPAQTQQSPFAAPAQTQQSPFAAPAPAQQSPFAAPANPSPFKPAPVYPDLQTPAYMNPAPVAPVYATPGPYQPAPVYQNPAPVYAPPAKKAPAVSQAPIPDDPQPVGDATPIHYVRTDPSKQVSAFPSPVEQPPIIPPSAAAIWGPAPTYETPATPAAPATEPKFCVMCGKPLPGGTNFCGKCGARIDEML